MTGYNAFHDSAAWIDISARGRLRVTGEDRQRLLHAIASNAVETLGAGQGAFAFFLNAQGRIQSDSRIFVAEHEVWIDCEPEARKTLREHIENYIIMDDVTLTDEADSIAALALEGPRAEEITRGVLGDVLPESALYSHRVANGVRVLRATLCAREGLWIFCAPDRKQQLVEQFAAAGAVQPSGEDIAAVRLENRRPRFGVDYTNANIPHETQLLQAVSFSKGCYLGQEIVERVRARGQVNKLLSTIELDTQDAPHAGSVVSLEAREAGQISSAAFSPRMGKALAFAILRREASDAGTEIAVASDGNGSIPGRVLGPPVQS